MRKKILSTLLALCMVAALLPTVALAAGTEHTIATDDQWKALFTSGGSSNIADGDTVIISGEFNVTHKATISNMNVTIQGADSSAKITTNVVDFLEVQSGGTLTLGANLTIESPNQGAILYANGGTINVEGAVLTSGGGNTTAFADNGGKLNISAGSVTSSTYPAVGANGNNTTVTIGGTSTVETKANPDNAAHAAAYAGGGATITVNGGKVIGTNDALAASNGGKVIVEDGDVDGGVISWQGEGSSVDISGGTVTGEVETQNGGDATISEDAKVEGNIVNNGEGDVAIKDGAKVTGSVTNNGAGTTAITGDETQTGAVTNTGSGTVDIDGGSIGDVTNSGSGTVDIDGGSTGDVTNSGTGSTTIDGATTGNVSNTGGTTTIGNGTTVDGEVSENVTTNSDTYSVTFDVNGGDSTPPTQYVASSGKVSEPDTPTRTNDDGTYTFAGWYSDDAFTTTWDFNSDTVSHNVTLYAKWDFTPSAPATITATDNSDGTYTVNISSLTATDDIWIITQVKKTGENVWVTGWTEIPRNTANYSFGAGNVDTLELWFVDTVKLNADGTLDTENMTIHGLTGNVLAQN